MIEILFVFHLGNIVHIRKNTINAQNESPPYVDIKSGNGTSLERDRSPNGIVAKDNPKYTVRFRLILRLINLRDARWLTRI